MAKRAHLYFCLSLLLCSCVGLTTVFAGPDPETVTLQANEEYVGEIDHKKTRYLKVTLTNLAAEASVCRIAFYRERVELGADRVGPVAYRTFTLEKENDSQTRIWTTLNFDEFTLNIETGNVRVTVEKPMQMH